MRMEGSGASRLVQLIRSYGYNKDVDFELATVVAPPPNLQITLDKDGLILEASDLVVCEHLTEHSRELTDGTTLTFRPALKVGDKVIVVSSEEKQQFLVIDKAVTY
jgi:Protein of unknown function (DUF2577)